MTRQTVLWEIATTTQLVGAAICIYNGWALISFIFIGLFGGLCKRQGRAEVMRNLQKTVDKMVWVKVEKVLKEADTQSRIEGSSK